MQKTALTLKEIGPSFQLETTTSDVKPPAPHNVLIKVHAAGINPVDAKLATVGHSQWVHPYTSGLDGAGEIIRTGENTSQFDVGDMVAWHSNLLHGGSFATHIELPEHILFRVPPSIDPVTAASIPCAGLTACLALQHRMQLTPNMYILIEAGSGGVGGFGIQIAKMMGLNVISTASPANHDYVTSLGADHVFNYTNPLLEQKILEATGNRRLDAVLDTIGCNAAQRNLNLLKHEGQIASLLGMPRTDEAKLFTIAPSIYIIALGGAHLSGDYVAQCRLATMGEEILAAIERGNIQPLPIKEIAFADIAVTQAMHQQLEVHIKGKQVIKIV